MADYSEYGGTFEEPVPTDKGTDPYSQYGGNFEEPTSAASNIEKQFAANASTPAPKQSFLERHPLLADIPKSYLSLGESLLDAPSHITNAILGRPAEYGIKPDSGINYEQLGLGKSDKMDKDVIDFLKYMPFTLGARGLVGAGEGLAENIFAQGVGGGAYGLTQDKNPFTAAGLNTLLGGATEATVGGAKKLFESVEPYAEKFINKISGGKNLEQNSQDVAKKIRDTYNWKNSNPDNPNNFKSRYNDILSVGSSPNAHVYKPVDVITGASNKGALGDLHLTKDDFEGDAKTWQKYQAMLKDPTALNLHNFQSYMGKEANKIRTNPLDTRKGNLSNYWNAQNAATGDLKSYLGKVHPSLPAKYDAVGQDWKNELLPYRATPTLRNIINGHNTNPTQAQLKRIFASPPIDPNAGVNKIISHQGPEFKDQILHAGLGISPENITAQKLISAASTLDKRGFGSYLTPEHKKAIAALPHIGARLNAVKTLGRFGGRALTGALIGHALGSNPEALGAAFMAGSAAPETLKALVGPKIAGNALLHGAKNIGKKAVNALTQSAAVTQAPNVYNEAPKRVRNYLNQWRSTQ